MQDHVYTPPPPPSKYYPYINHGVENVILKSIEKNSDARFQTVEQFGAALEHPEALAYTPSVAPADAPTMSIGGGSTLSHPHLSVSAVPPAAPSAATPAPSSGASGPAASLATPVPLPTAVPTVPSNPAIGATRVPAPTILQSSAPTSAPLPTQLPIAAPKSKKPLIIAAAALASSRRRRRSLPSLEPHSPQRLRLFPRPASRAIRIARSQRTFRSHSRDRRASSHNHDRPSSSGSQTKTRTRLTPARSTPQAHRARPRSRPADVSKGAGRIQPATLL